MNKTTAELEGKKKELVAQVQLFQEKANDLQSQLIGQQDESNAQVCLFKPVKGLELFNRLLSWCKEFQNWNWS